MLINKIQSKIPGIADKTMTTATGEVRQALIIKINAKNSYGAYGGAKTYRCIIGADNSTPISINEW